MDYTLSYFSNCGGVKKENDSVTLFCEKDTDDAQFSLCVNFDAWEEDAFILMPACAYDGNRFPRVERKYPPKYFEDEQKVDATPIITDVPAINPDWSGKIQVTSGDLSVPIVSVFFPNEKKAFFLFTVQQFKSKNIGFCVEKQKITVLFPTMRTEAYSMCNSHSPSPDSGEKMKTGEYVTLPFVIRQFDCEDITSLYELFFEHRKDVCRSERAKTEYTPALWKIMEDHFNDNVWSGQYYSNTDKLWQSGWVGGGMSSLPLWINGSALTRERAEKTLDFMCTNVSALGFFHATIRDGVFLGDGFGYEGLENSVFIRKEGDALFYLFKHLEVMPKKDLWVNAAKKATGALCAVFEKYGEFGQFVDCVTGEIIVGGSTAGASVVSALVKAEQFFGEPKYLEIAKKSYRDLYEKFVKKGYTLGGPGEILCAPDSESAYAMVDSGILLYERTGDKFWLECAKHSAHLFSSWVMTYAYAFPSTCEFHRLKINTTGSVFANVQNKHSAPGICTSSGLSLYKLYKYTGNEQYLTLLKDITFFIPQCICTPTNQIYSWDNPPQPLSYGFICERVNTSDWEGEQYIGGVWNGSCWCETTAVLCYLELFQNDEIKRALTE